MKFDDAYAAIVKIFPEATFEEDNQGQAIIYTNTRYVSTDEFVPFDPKDDK